MRRALVVGVVMLLGLFVMEASAGGAPKQRIKSCSVSVPSEVGGTNELCHKVSKCTFEITVTVTGDPGSDGIAQCFDSGGLIHVNAECTIPPSATSCTDTKPVPFAGGTFFFCGVGHVLPASDTPVAECSAFQN